MSTLLTTAQNRLSSVQKNVGVNGMVAVESKKEDASGNKSVTLQLRKKKDFMASWFKLPGNSEKTSKEAARAFEQYRIATLREYNQRLGAEILSGNIVAEKMKADGFGDLRTISLARRARVNTDKALAEIDLVANLMKQFPGKTLEEIRDLVAKGNVAPSLDIETSEPEPAAKPESVAAADPAQRTA